MHGVTQCDWLDGVAALPRHSVDLLYADPPFNTGAAKSSPPGAARAGRTEAASYRDAWDSPALHASWVRDRIKASLPALRPAANLLLHCDWRSSHHLRLMLDEVLGPGRFVNHLVWSYGLGGSSPRAFARKHDDILFYRLSDYAYFEPPRVPATSRRMAGLTKKATDVLDIPSLNNMSKERTGYPTQKPLALLDLLVRACCPPGGTVLDPCCGSGTTLVAAAAAGRNAVGFDLSAAAVRTSRLRLRHLDSPAWSSSGAGARKGRTGAAARTAGASSTST